jgi:rhamnogalacturonyl hydrolase YesR
MRSNDMTRILSDDLLSLVASRTAACDIRIWGFGVGPALLGLLRAGDALDEPTLIDHVDALVTPSLGAAPDPTDHLISIETLVALRRLRPARDIDDAASRFRRAIVDAARPVSGRPPVHRPDLPALSRTVWVDCMHTDGPGLFDLGLTAEAAAATETAADALQDDTGLFSHSYDVATGEVNGVHWGRGQGWALHGLVHTAPDDRLSARLDRLLAALAQTEDDGRWRTIVDDPGAPHEASVSAIVASGILLGISAGRVGTQYLPLADRALHAAVELLDADGGLPVSEATPAGAPGIYLTRATDVYPWGQGPLLLALTERRYLL